MIRIKLSEEEKAKLEKLRTGGISEKSEKTLMVLLNSEGFSPKMISDSIHRNPHTIRMWLKRYKEYGVAGFNRYYSPGRPRKYGDAIHQIIKSIIEKSPTEFNYKSASWTGQLLVDYLKQRGYSISIDTVKRTLKRLNYVYKRPSKTVPANAPTPEKKREQIVEMLAQIKRIVSRKDQECEILFLGESHFSTDPYVTRSWIKKDLKKTSHLIPKGQIHSVWCIKTKRFTYILQKGVTGA
jgi:transposase